MIAIAMTVHNSFCCDRRRCRGIHHELDRIEVDLRAFESNAIGTFRLPRDVPKATERGPSDPS